MPSCEKCSRQHMGKVNNNILPEIYMTSQKTYKLTENKNPLLFTFTISVSSQILAIVKGLFRAYSRILDSESICSTSTSSEHECTSSGQNSFCLLWTHGPVQPQEFASLQLSFLAKWWHDSATDVNACEWSPGRHCSTLCPQTQEVCGG